MKEEFVTKGIAKKLKEKGFKEECFGYYLPGGDTLIFNYNQWRGGIYEDCLYSHNSFGEDVIGSDLIDVPTIFQALKWLREEKGLHIEIRFDTRGFGACVDKYDIHTLEYISFNPLLSFGFHKSYEEAVIEGIEYVIDNLI